MAIGGTVTINSITYTIVGQITGPQDQWVLGTSSTTVAYDNRGVARRFVVALYLTTDNPGVSGTPIRFFTTNHFKTALEYLADWLDSRNKCTASTRVGTPSVSAATILTIVNKTVQTISISDQYSTAPTLQDITNRFQVTDSLRSGVTRRFPHIRFALRYVAARLDSRNLYG